MPKSKIPTVYAKDIANKLAEEVKITKQNALSYTNAVMQIIVDELIAGNKVNISTIGIFTVKEYAEKQVKESNRRNPRTGETIVKPAHVKPAHKKLRFTASKQINQRLN